MFYENGKWIFQSRNWSNICKNYGIFNIRSYTPSQYHVYCVPPPLCILCSSLNVHIYLCMFDIQYPSCFITALHWVMNILSIITLDRSLMAPPLCKTYWEIYQSCLSIYWFHIGNTHGTQSLGSVLILVTVVRSITVITLHVNLDDNQQMSKYVLSVQISNGHFRMKIV